MSIPRLLTETLSLIEPGHWLNRGAVANAAAAVAYNETQARVREDTRRAVDRANLSARLMRRATG